MSPFGQQLFQAPVTLALFAVNIAVFVWASSHGDTRDVPTLIRFGATWRGLVWHGEWWRLFTSMFLHIGLIHLVWNTVAGWSFCARAEQLFGRARFLSLYLASGVAGSALSVIGHEAVSAGASGAMFGIIGAELMLGVKAAGSVGAFLENPAAKKQLIWIVAWFAIGEYSGFDNYGHLGGLLFGLLFASVIQRDNSVGVVSVLKVALPLLLLVAASLRPLPVVHAETIAITEATEAAKRGDAEAVLALTRHAVGDGANSQLLALRLWALLTLERYDAADLTIDQLVTRPGYEAFALRNRATLRLRDEHTEQALKILDQSLVLEPDNPEALALRAWANGLLGHDEAALADAQRAEQLGVPAQYHRSLLWVWGRFASPQVALEHAQSAVTHFPDDAQLPVFLADALFDSGREADARAELDRFLARSPKSASGLTLKSYFLARAGAKADAFEALAEAAKADPKSGEVVALGGWFHAHHDELDAAESAFKASHAIKPNAPAYSGLAWVAIRRHHFEEAAAASKHALALDRSNPDAWLMQAEVARADGRDAEAAEAYARALRLGGPRWWEAELATNSLKELAADGGR